ncbi:MULTISPECIES: RagB/SusD family nutrient uptake outer membrane protein [unclassified Spirosoma]|uniref:RagB/SusD family nutrient uptake outer membrane protein n=1 Tax=unclassified Spirosoma TaxID=2621999 RepID=UPI00095A83F0|nr:MULTISPECIES: RagB/SusD family nutrient uptake outer membrane protein [unclassified Spirosoma]MBN8826724.1 RagB/SusD family nutrient uptake outer membrane protein [Spirosoma sp.]OJW73816.1 MAG: RagB/SusD family nutrient uptake outer membrane protein [Spirosoma sp. 48-14]
MKRYFKYIAVVCLTLLGASSCNRDLLTPIPQTSVSDASAFSTTTRVQTQLLSLYGALKDGNFYGGRYVIYGDIRGEEFINETSNLVTGSDVWGLNATNSATAVVNLWYFAYLAINKCNIFLDGMAAGGSNVVGTDASAKYIAEAKFIRALSYYSLLQYYARPYADGNGTKPGVPLRLNGIKGVGQSDLVRSSVADVYAQVLKDLNEAEASLPSTYATAADNTTRAHKNTAIALKTRVYLSMQNYASVITEANKIVSATAPFKAPTGVANQLQADIATVFTNYTTTESILSMPMTSTSGDFPGTQNQLAYYFSPNTANGGVGNGEYSLNAKGIIAEPTWTATDKRRSFIKQSGSGANLKNWLIKYKAPSPYTDYVPVMRYSEVLLNLAEAKVRSTNTVDAQAVALLNAVRNRSDAATTFTAANFATSTDLINAILLERRIEFLGEGLRNNDLVRLLQTIPAKGTVPAKTASEPNYIWPISASELALNKLATDN